jgi:hypothetical protein
MADKLTFTIPIFPHVKKFIAHRYGLRSPIKVSENLSLGKMISFALMDKRHRNLASEPHHDGMTDSVTLILTEDQLRMTPRIKRLIVINTDFHQLFKEHLMTYILAQKSMGVPAKAACRNYLSDMGINEKEYSIESAYKYYQRTTRPNFAKEGLVG